MATVIIASLTVWTFLVILVSYSILFLIFMYACKFYELCPSCNGTKEKKGCEICNGEGFIKQHQSGLVRM